MQRPRALSRRSALGTFSSAPAFLRSAQARRPNLLLLLSDDHSYPYLGCYGQPWLNTPHLDKLASEGLRFDRCFTVAPQCVPSRAGIISGRSAVSTRMTRFSAPLPRDVVSLPEVLRDNGYFTGACGRHFHLDGAQRNKFTLSLMQKHRLMTFADRVNWLDRGSAMPGTLDRIGEFFDQRQADRPYFLWVNFSDPHHVWNAPPVEPAKVKMPAHFPELPGLRQDLAKYCGEIQRLDGQVQQVLDVVARRASLDNTLVLFMGDNGMALPRGKGSLHDPGLNVPLLASWKGVVKPGGTSDALISGEDIAPSFLDAAGIPVPRYMTGQSFAPLLRGEAHRRRTHIFAERALHGNGTYTPQMRANGWDLARCARSDRWKLIYNCTPAQQYAPVDSGRDAGWQEMVAAHEAGKLPPALDRAYFSHPRPLFELYDLQADPAELNNLAGAPEHAGVERSLKEALHEKMLLDSDYLPLPLAE